MNIEELKSIDNILLVATFRDAVKQVNELAEQLAKEGFEITYDIGFVLCTKASFIKAEVKKNVIY